MSDQPGQLARFWYGPTLQHALIADAGTGVFTFGPFPQSLIVDGVLVMLSTPGAGIAGIGVAWVNRSEATAADMIGGRNLVEEVGPAAGQPPAVDVRVSTPSPVVIPIAIGSPPHKNFPYLAVFVTWNVTAAGSLSTTVNVAAAP